MLNCTVSCSIHHYLYKIGLTGFAGASTLLGIVSAERVTLIAGTHCLSQTVARIITSTGGAEEPHRARAFSVTRETISELRFVTDLRTILERICASGGFES